MASAAEPSVLFSPLLPVVFPSVIVYRKVAALPAPAPSGAAEPGTAAPEPLPEPPRPAPVPAPGKKQLVERSRARANAGDLAEALSLCDLALKGDRLDARLHYLRGSILQEGERLEEAVHAFRRAVRSGSPASSPHTSRLARWRGSRAGGRSKSAISRALSRSCATPRRTRSCLNLLA